jgi:hypothetical protein
MKKWLFLLTFVSCAGYRFQQDQNPLAQYGINSLSVPMFYNESNFPEVSPMFTKEIYHLLTSYSGLKVHSGFSLASDAVLIGIIKSSQKRVESQAPLNLRVAQQGARNSIGQSREDFYVPGSNSLNMSLRIIVIKQPTADELEVLHSSFGEQVAKSSKIIFNETFTLTNSFNREILDNEGTQVVGTQNKGSQFRTQQNMAKEAATLVRDMILYAF